MQSTGLRVYGEMLFASPFLLCVASAWLLRPKNVDLRKATLHHKSPIVLHQDDFATPAECAEIIRLATPRLFKSEVVENISATFVNIF